MQIRIETVYQCEFCSKIYIIKKWAQKHEHCCRKNPRNENLCVGCDYFDISDSWCDKLEKGLISRAQKVYGDNSYFSTNAAIMKHECLWYTRKNLPF